MPSRSEQSKAEFIGPPAGPRVSRLETPPAEIPSFETVYRHYLDFVWSTVWRYGVEPEAREDLVQEIFLVVHAKLATVQRPEALRSWIYSVARRTVSSHRRAKRACPAPCSVVEAADSEVVSREPTPLQRTETKAQLELLAELLEKLVEPKREVFTLMELAELSASEVAERLGISEDAAYSRLRAARHAFDAALSRHVARKRKPPRSRHDTRL